MTNLSRSGSLRRPRRTIVGPLLTAVAVGATVVATGTAPPSVSAGVPGPETIQILSFNDYHGHVKSDDAGSINNEFGGPAAGGGEYLSSKLTALRAEAAGDGIPASGSFTVAAGDLIGGSPFFSGLFHDEPSVESLNAMGLDFSGVGNHEFDEGVEELLRMQRGGCHPEDGCYFEDDPATPDVDEADPFRGADFRWLAANVIEDAPDGTDDFADIILPYDISFTAQGHKVAFIGMTLEGTDELVAASGIEGFTFQDEVEAGAATVAAIKADDPTVNAMVLMLHEGGLPTPFAINGCEGISGPIVAIADGMDEEIDAIVTGHTHQPYTCAIDDPDDNPRPVVSAFSFGRVVTEVRLDLDATGEVDRTTFSMENHPVVSEEFEDFPILDPDPAITEIIAKYTPLATEIGAEQLGTITGDILRGGGPTDDRGIESNAGNLVADAQLFAVRAADIDVDVALMNAGGLRSDLLFDKSGDETEDGIVTFAEALTFQPFNNTMFVLAMTGAQLQSVLEEQCQPAGSSRAFQHLGVSNGLTYDLATEFADNESGDCIAIEVTKLQLDGTDIDPNATYRVAVNNFLADGGDNFDTFTKVDPADRTPGPQDIDALTRYLEAESPIDPPGTDRVNEVNPIESLDPIRLLDSRIGDEFTTTDGRFEGDGPLPAKVVTTLDIAGRGDVPVAADAVILNIGAIDPVERGFLTVWDCAEPRPLASSVNFRPDGVVATAALSELNVDGQVCIYPSHEIDVIVDLTAVVPVGGSPQPTGPARILETRVGNEFTTIDGEFEGTGPVTGGSPVELQVAGRAGVPLDADGVILNIAGINPALPGFIVAYPCDEERPNSSNLNATPGTTKSSLVTAKLSATGTTCIYTSGDIDLIADVTAYIPNGASPASISPTRLLETRVRADFTTVDGAQQGTNALLGGTFTAVKVAGRGDIPDDITSVVLNIASVRPAARGFISVLPSCGTASPTSSTLNFRAGEVTSNLAISQIGPDGSVCIYVSETTDMIVDVTASVSPVTAVSEIPT
ncbi:MAG: bifunctional UDP-sugar hydrolase/5'-nucleotidase [Ilumatobacter sp.]